MTDLDKMARELLAGELARDGWAGELAAVLLADRPDDARVPGNMALATIRTALMTAPPGYVLVPVEPTPLMIATFRADNEHGALSWMTHTTLRCGDFGSRYAGMIAAAPEVE